MSIFGTFMRDMEEDPFFSAQARSFQQMHSMMNGMMTPFDSMFNMGFPMLTNGNRQNQLVAQQRRGGFDPFDFGRPFQFPNMGNMMGGFVSTDPMTNDPNCHSYASSSVMTYTTGEDGQPRVYKSSASTRTAPGGVKETRKSEMNSDTGLQRMAIGHHIGERGHVMERTQNRRTGEQEENQEYINLEEEEAEGFNSEWSQQAQGSYGSSRQQQSLGHHPRRREPTNPMLAITDREAPGPSRSRRRDDDTRSRKHDKHRTKGTPRP